MKRFLLSRPPFAGFAALAIAASALTGCDKPEPGLTPEQQEQEVQRRVAQKLDEERLARQQATLSEKERELAEREKSLSRREETPPPAAPTQSAPEPVYTGTPAKDDDSYNVFYESLEPHGAWFETAAYGPVWQPNVAQRDPAWRPYTLGRWAYTEQGWAWVSDEPFGWATYHYGRWTRLVGTGWVWVPGDQWAPAWVSWRNNDDYVGWAPLPPASQGVTGNIGIRADEEYNIAPAYYSFVPLESFGDVELYNEIVDPGYNVTILTRTVNVTNIIISRNSVINYGPAYNVMQRRARRPLELWKIDRHGHGRGKGDHRTVAEKGVLRFDAPVIDAKRNPNDRPKVKRRIDDVKVDRSPQPAEPRNQRPREKQRTPTPSPTQPAQQTPSPSQPPAGPSRTPRENPDQRPTATPQPNQQSTPAPTPWVTPTPSGPPPATPAPATPAQEQPSAPAPTPWVTPTPWGRRPAATPAPAAPTQEQPSAPAPTPWVTPTPWGRRPAATPVPATPTQEQPSAPAPTPWVTPTPWGRRPATLPQTQQQPPQQQQPQPTPPVQQQPPAQQFQQRQRPDRNRPQQSAPPTQSQPQQQQPVSTPPPQRYDNRSREQSREPSTPPHPQRQIAQSAPQQAPQQRESRQREVRQEFKERLEQRVLERQPQQPNSGGGSVQPPPKPTAPQPPTENPDGRKERQR